LEVFRIFNELTRVNLVFTPIYVNKVNTVWKINLNVSFYTFPLLLLLFLQVNP
jgi:hypothetical protein